MYTTAEDVNLCAVINILALDLIIVAAPSLNVKAPV